MHRRTTVLGLLLTVCATAPADDIIRDIGVETIKKGREGGGTWFHPRGCTLPDGTVFWTVQQIFSSDAFGPVHEMLSKDAGKNWQAPVAIPSLGRHTRADEVAEGVCDVVPEYHAKTKSVLAMGHNVFYKANKFFTPQPPRWPVYAVRDAEGKWSPMKKLEWDDPRGKQLYTSGCSQRVTLENGDVLLAMSFGPTAKAVRSVATFLCSFDGQELKIKKVGTELKGKAGRGLLEPSLAYLDGVFYMTIRAEDGHGYVTTSNDGLEWKTPIAWQFSDGEAIAMSTTQQRWLVHSDGLYLVFTRKAAENAKVMRWRAPLYVSQVDRKSLGLVKATERIAIPMVGDGLKDPTHVPHLGNFHTQAVSATESLITVGEVIPANFRGDLVLGRVTWKSPNKLAP